MLRGVTIRQLLAEETDEAARIHRAAALTGHWWDPGRHTPQEDRQFYAEIVFPGTTMLGAFRGHRLLGYCAFAAGWVDHLFVDPLWHGRGLGSALLEKAKAGVDELQLWTFQANTGARRFYERSGFAPQELTDGWGTDEQMPDVRYRWRRQKS